MGVVGLNIFVDGGDQGIDTLKDPAPDALLGDLPKPAFYLVQPGAAGGSEVKVKARTFLEPGGHLGSLVGSVVVQNQMDFQFSRNRAVDLVQEAQELLVSMLL